MKHLLGTGLLKFKTKKWWQTSHKQLSQLTRHFIIINLTRQKKPVRHDYLQKQKQKHTQQEIYLFYTYLLFGHSK